jgi:hypothetical protein
MNYEELKNAFSMLISSDEDTRKLGKSILINSKFYKQYKNERIYCSACYVVRDKSKFKVLSPKTLKEFINYIDISTDWYTLNYLEKMISQVLMLHKKWNDS